jgi:hypothetical protein
MEVIAKLKKNGIDIHYDDIVKVCQKYNIVELSIFGSAIRDDFGAESDVDILVSFDVNAHSTIADLLDLKDIFMVILNRDVDIVEKEGLVNPIRKEDILSTKEILYAV